MLVLRTEEWVVRNTLEINQLEILCFYVNPRLPKGGGYHPLVGSVVQRFMGLPRTRKGHGSSPSRGAC